MPAWKPADEIDGLKVDVQMGESPFGRREIIGLRLSGRTIRADDLRKIQVGAIERAANVGVDTRPDLEPLTRRSAEMSPEDFSALVAEYYREFCRHSRTPAAVMARQAGVPATTIHRWIREARLRGFLPPGRRGKVG